MPELAKISGGHDIGAAGACGIAPNLHLSHISSNPTAAF
jgi:hypothetical protein